MQANSVLQQQNSSENGVAPRAGMGLSTPQLLDPGADVAAPAKPSLHGPVVGLAIALAFALLVTGQILLFLHFYGDTLAPTRLPYAEDFSHATRLDYRQFGGRWAVNDAKLVQFDTQDTDLLAVLPNLAISAGDPYTFSTKIQVLAGPKGGGLVFNMQDSTSREESHMVRFGTGDSGDYLVWGYFDETAMYVAQGTAVPPAFTDVVDLAVAVGPESYAVLVNGAPVAEDVPLQYTGGHLALTTWFSSIAFDDVAVSKDGWSPAAVTAPVAVQPPADAVTETAPVTNEQPTGEDNFLDSRPVDSYFTAAFGDPAAADGWRSVDGEWQFQDGALVQMTPDGYDRTIVHAGRFTDYTLRVQLAHREGAGGGVLFNVTDVTRNKSGHLVRYMEPGVVAWGYFDEQRDFQGQGGAEVDAAGSAPHTLAVTVTGATYAVALDGTTLATDIPLVQRGGAVGLTASTSVVAFTEMTVEPAAIEPAAVQPATE